MIHGFSNVVRQKISEEFENRMCSVMVDGCSREFRHFIGINVQTVIDGKLFLRTLAVEEMLLSSTAENLKTVITRVLRKYGISPQQVSFTTDNGENYLLAAKLLRETEEEIDELDELQPDWPELEIQQGDFRVQSVRCAAYTLQLDVGDALKKNTTAKPLLDKVYALAKYLRTASKVSGLKERKIPIPILDVITRWGSTYDMARSVERGRCFVESNFDARELAEYNLSATEWEELECLLDDLRPLRKATHRLQKKDLFLGEFMAIWMEAQRALVLLLKRRTTSLAPHLLEAMEAHSKPKQYSKIGKKRGERHSSLFHYKSFDAAIFLDPRYNALLTADEIVNAKSYLVELWQRLRRLRGLAGPVVVSDDDSTVDEPEEMDECEADFAAFLAQKNQERIAAQGGTATLDGSKPDTTQRLHDLLDLYDRAPPIPAHSNVLEFWETKRLIWPELYDLASIVLAIPATKVSVERLFSELRFILRLQRYHLTAMNVHDVTFLHAYSELVEQLVKEKEAKKTRSLLDEEHESDAH